MCDGRPVASSPFRRLASRGSPFRGFPAWWPSQIAICLARCLTIHDSGPRYSESIQPQCHDTSSCYFYTALWLGQCQSILTQTQHLDELDMVCCRISLFSSQVGPTSFEWPVAPAGGFYQSSLSPSREDLNDEHLENARLAPPQLLWKRDALEPQEIQQARLNKRTCVHIPDGLRCVTWNLRKLMDLLFPLERRHSYFTRLAKNSNIICIQEIHGKREFLQAIQVLAPHFRLFGTFIAKNLNASGSGFLQT